jgi:hypothetical protein
VVQQLDCATIARRLNTSEQQTARARVSRGLRRLGRPAACRTATSSWAGRNSRREAGVNPGMYTNNPEARYLIEQGILRIAPLRPRSTADVTRIRAALNR